MTMREFGYVANASLLHWKNPGDIELVWTAQPSYAEPRCTLASIRPCGNSSACLDVKQPCFDNARTKDMCSPDPRIWCGCRGHPRTADGKFCSGPPPFARNDTALTSDAGSCPPSEPGGVHVPCPCRGVGPPGVADGSTPQGEEACGGQNNQVGIPATLENVFELLPEQPGTWYFDRAERFIYYAPREGELMDEDVVAVVAQSEQLLKVVGSSDLSFDGIMFEHTSWFAPNTPHGFVEWQGGVHCRDSCVWWKCLDATLECHPPRDLTLSAVAVHSSQHVTFSRCSFTNLGGAGLAMLDDSSYVSVLNSSFNGISGGAVLLGNENFTQRNHHFLVSRNVVHDVAVEFHGAYAVSGMYVSDAVVEFNDISRCFAAVSMGWGSGIVNGNMARNTIRYNHIHDYMCRANGLFDESGGVFTTSGVTPPRQLF